MNIFKLHFKDSATLEKNIIDSSWLEKISSYIKGLEMKAFMSASIANPINSSLFSVISFFCVGSFLNSIKSSMQLFSSLLLFWNL